MNNDNSRNNRWKKLVAGVLAAAGLTWMLSGRANEEAVITAGSPTETSAPTPTREPTSVPTATATATYIPDIPEVGTDGGFVGKLAEKREPKLREIQEAAWSDILEKNGGAPAWSLRNADLAILFNGLELGNKVSFAKGGHGFEVSEEGILTIFNIEENGERINTSTYDGTKTRPENMEMIRKESGESGQGTIFHPEVNAETMYHISRGNGKFFMAMAEVLSKDGGEKVMQEFLSSRDAGYIVENILYFTPRIPDGRELDGDGDYRAIPGKDGGIRVEFLGNGGKEFSFEYDLMRRFRKQIEAENQPYHGR